MRASSRPQDQEDTIALSLTDELQAALVAGSDELARWRGVVDTRLGQLEGNQQNHGVVLHELRGYFEASLARLHEDVCGSLGTLEKQAFEQAVVNASLLGSLKALKILLPLLYGLLTAGVAVWLKH